MATFDTPLKNLNFSEEVANFWDQKIVEKYDLGWACETFSPFKNSQNFPRWHKLKNNFNIYNLFDKLRGFQRDELCHLAQNPIENNDFYKELNTAKFLNLLAKNGVDIVDCIKQNQEKDPDNIDGWKYISLLELVNTYLWENKKFISDDYLNLIIKEKKETNKKSNYFQEDLKTEINLFFSTWENLHPKKHNINFFIETLNVFATKYDKQSNTVLLDCLSFSYDTQKQIKNYMETHYPKYLQEYQQYYSDICKKEDFFSFNNSHQQTLNLNLYQILEQYNINEDKLHQFTNIINYVFKTIQSDTFLNMIGKDLSLINTTTINQNKKSIVFCYSSKKKEDLEEFGKILKYSIQGILDDFNTLNYSESNDWDGKLQIITNINNEFLVKKYTVKKLENETSKKEFAIKNFKI